MCATTTDPLEVQQLTSSLLSALFKLRERGGISVIQRVHALIVAPNTVVLMAIAEQKHALRAKNIYKRTQTRSD